MGKKPQGKKKPSKPAASGKAQQEEEEIIPHRALYVGNLAGLAMTETKLKELFECCGEVTSVSLVETAKHAFGFVEFVSVAEAESAIEKMNGELGMLVKFAKNTASQPFAPPSRTRQAEEKEVSSDDGDESEDKAEPEKEAPLESVSAPLLDLATARAAAARVYSNPVETLHDFVQKATRATSTREYIIYTDEEDDLGFFIATVEVKVPAGRTSHSGEPKENKKEAKKSAAQVALRDPALHRLLPALPKEIKVQEPRVAKVAVAADTDSDQSTEEGAPASSTTTGSTPALSKKEQQKLEKAELARKRKAAKAARAAWAALQEEDDDDEDEEEEDADAQESVEGESEEEESDDSSGSEEDDGSKLDPEALAAKKAAVKAALAKRATKKGGSKSAAAKERRGNGPVKESAKDATGEFKFADKVKDTRLQANFGATKFIKP